MAHTPFNYDRAARALAHATLDGDEAAAKHAGVTTRTLYNYRKRLTTDTTLSDLFLQKKATLEREWANEIAPTLRAALKFLQRAANQADPTNPDVIHAVAGALKLVHEAKIIGEVIDHRLTDPARETHQENRPGHPTPHTPTN